MLDPGGLRSLQPPASRTDSGWEETARPTWPVAPARPGGILGEPDVGGQRGGSAGAVLDIAPVSHAHEECA
jgi:hypothetical protein